MGKKVKRCFRRFVLDKIGPEHRLKALKMDKPFKDWLLHLWPSNYVMDSHCVVKKNLHMFTDNQSYWVPIFMHKFGDVSLALLK